jgi:hypothetical protein
VNCGEPWYAIAQAAEIHSQSIGGEPEERFVVRELAKAGFSAEDLSNFYLIRMIPVLKREKRFKRRDFARWAAENLENYRRELGLAGRYSVGDFKKWYARNMTDPKDFMNIEVSDTGPGHGVGTTFLQKISYAVNIARDRSAIAVAEHMLNQFDRVVIVYGASHFLNQAPAFTRSLGEPQYEKLF